MIQIQQIKLKIPHTEVAIEKKFCRLLRISPRQVRSWKILRRSLDARRKPELYYVYTVEVETAREHVLRKQFQKNPSISFRPPLPKYSYRADGERELSHRPVIVGTGPAGLFCGYALARMGYRPILLERGAAVEERKRDVEEFWKSGRLLPDSNVQFGEGGAGTFSDGKLNTLVHDPDGLGREVLRLFAVHGAPDEVLYDSKPHVGTDRLIQLVRALRESILQMGGEVRFHARAADIQISRNPEGDRKVCSVTVEDTGSSFAEVLKTEVLVLAIGHSSRDTFALLEKKGVPMEPKAFAVGVRIEHPQTLIDENQYGQTRGSLPAASYKLTTDLPNKRGAYTFCMCPGGYVVNASSELGRCAVNGMSYSGRDGHNANSAVIVTVRPEDYPGDGPLAGVEFQQRLEEAAFRQGKGSVPVQQFGDFCKGQPSLGPGRILPQIKGSYTWGDVRSIFPEELGVSIEKAVRDFDRKIPGFARDDAPVSGVESRTSSPVRILRDPSLLESAVKGVYPCGEGAGYAGGITSAAMDGLKTARAVSQIYRPFDKGGNV